MSVAETTQIPPQEEIEALLPKVELVETDGQPLESDWHRLEMNLLIEVVTCRNGDRQDYYCGGNMFIYFSEQHARDRDFRGPDFFYVEGVNRAPLRDYWVVWKEDGRYPDVIIELTSNSTRREDHTIKKDTYEMTFRTYEYFCYDPDSQLLEGWRLEGDRYKELVPDAQGRLECKKLGLRLGLWRGEFNNHHADWLRFFTPDGALVPLYREVERRRAEAAEAEVARLKAIVAGQAKSQ